MSDLSDIENLLTNFHSPIAVPLVLKLGKAALDSLIRELENDDPKVRGRAAWLLAKIPDEKAVASILAIVEDNDPAVRQAAIEALGNIHAPQTIDILIRFLLHDSESSVRSWAAMALSKFEDERVVAPLIHSMQNDPEPEVRRLAAFALRTTKDTRSIEPLISALFDSASIVRTFARYALDEFRDIARPALRQLFEEDREKINQIYNKISWDWVEYARNNQELGLSKRLEHLEHNILDLAQKGKIIETMGWENTTNQVKKMKQIHEKTKHNCPICGRAANDLAWFDLLTPPEIKHDQKVPTGWMTVCDNCHIQVDFFSDKVK